MQPLGRPRQGPVPIRQPPVCGEDSSAKSMCSPALNPRLCHPGDPARTQTNCFMTHRNVENRVFLQSSFKCKQKTLLETTASSCMKQEKKKKNRTALKLKSMIHLYIVCGFIVTLIFLHTKLLQRFEHQLSQHTVALLSNTLVKPDPGWCP